MKFLGSLRRHERNLQSVLAPFRKLFTRSRTWRALQFIFIEIYRACTTSKVNSGERKSFSSCSKARRLFAESVINCGRVQISEAFVIVKLLGDPQVFQRIRYEVLVVTDSKLEHQISQMSHPWPAVHDSRGAIDLYSLKEGPFVSVELRC